MAKLKLPKPFGSKTFLQDLLALERSPEVREGPAWMKPWAEHNFGPQIHYLIIGHITDQDGDDELEGVCALDAKLRPLPPTPEAIAEWCQQSIGSPEFDEGEGEPSVELDDPQELAELLARQPARAAEISCAATKGNGELRNELSDIFPELELAGQSSWDDYESYWGAFKMPAASNADAGGGMQPASSSSHQAPSTTTVSPTPQRRMLAPRSHPTDQSVGYGKYKPNDEILSTTDHHSPDDSSHQLPGDSVVELNTVELNLEDKVRASAKPSNLGPPVVYIVTGASCTSVPDQFLAPPEVHDWEGAIEAAEQMLIRLIEHDREGREDLVQEAREAFIDEAPSDPTAFSIKVEDSGEQGIWQVDVTPWAADEAFIRRAAKHVGAME